MKAKQKVDIISAIFLTLIAVVLLILPQFKILTMRYIIVSVYIMYAIINLIRFLITIKSKDYEGLHYTLASIVAIIINLVIDLSSPRYLSLGLFCWISLVSLSKLKKIDYYHDKRDRMWKFAIADLLIFLITGILACMNLFYSTSVQILIIGFFFLINGILEIFDPIMKSLIAHS
jgi:uncharacterized membrane protein HdeD (DUF308 family)